jgi:hypothetical protein
MQICIELAGIECSLGHFEKCEDLVQHVLLHAKSLDDKIPAYVTQVESFNAQGDLVGAVKQGLETLEMLGESIPRRTRKTQLIFDFMVTTGVLKAMTDEEIVGLPSMEDAKKILAMQMLSKSCVSGVVNRRSRAGSRTLSSKSQAYMPLRERCDVRALFRLFWCRVCKFSQS